MTVDFFSVNFRSLTFFNQDWTLATLYNLAGKDGKEDFDLLMAEVDSDQATWFDVVQEEYTHEFGDHEDADVFDANDKSYRVRKSP